MTNCCDRMGKLKPGILYKRRNLTSKLHSAYRYFVYGKKQLCVSHILEKVLAVNETDIKGLCTAKSRNHGGYMISSHAAPNIDSIKLKMNYNSALIPSFSHFKLHCHEPF